MKPGYKTTEFWVTLAGNGLAIAEVLSNSDLYANSPIASVILASAVLILNGLYTLGRSLVKGAKTPNTETVTPQG